MSSQRGNVKKKKAQKHQNSTAFKNNLHDTSTKTKMINDIQVTQCCSRCTEIIEWKIKYKKYKPLTVPKKWYVILRLTSLTRASPCDTSEASGGVHLVLMMFSYWQNRDRQIKMACVELHGGLHTAQTQRPIIGCFKEQPIVASV